MLGGALAHQRSQVVVRARGRAQLLDREVVHVCRVVDASGARQPLAYPPDRLAQHPLHALLHERVVVLHRAHAVLRPPEVRVEALPGLAVEASAVATGGVLAFAARGRFQRVQLVEVLFRVGGDDSERHVWPQIPGVGVVGDRGAEAHAAAAAEVTQQRREARAEAARGRAAAQRRSAQAIEVAGREGGAQAVVRLHDARQAAQPSHQSRRAVVDRLQ